MLFATKLPQSRHREPVFAPRVAKTDRLSYLWKETQSTTFNVKTLDVDERLASGHVSRASGSTDRGPFAHESNKFTPFQRPEDGDGTQSTYPIDEDVRVN